MYKYEHILNFFWSLRTDNKCSLHLKSFPACLTYLLANPLTFCLKPTHYPLSNPPTSFQTHYPLSNPPTSYQTCLPPAKPMVPPTKPTYLISNLPTSCQTHLPPFQPPYLPNLLTSYHIYSPPAKSPYSCQNTYLLPNLYFLPTQSTSC